MSSEPTSLILPPPQEGLLLSDGEVHFLWWFIQGSIMNPETRQRLHRAWGLCSRHAAGLLMVEAAYRHGWLHACAILYLDLVERAVAALAAGGPLAGERIRGRLRARGPCLMCELQLEQAGGGAASADLLARGRDPSQLRHFAASCRPFWTQQICPRCQAGAPGPLCRPHFVAAQRTPPWLVGSVDDLVRQERSALGAIARHLIAYARSFRWEHRGPDGPEDRAALLAAVGWCSGWDGLLAALGAETIPPAGGPTSGG